MWKTFIALLLAFLHLNIIKCFLRLTNYRANTQKISAASAGNLLAIHNDAIQNYHY